MGTLRADPVRVRNTFHFAYEDGTAYYPVGTTCYVWELQNDALIRQTLDSLKASGFNKIRFCIFPKHYLYNLHDPRSFPYEGTPVDCRLLNEDNFNNFNGAAPGNSWNFTRFNPEHFRHIETCILELQKLGIEADLIIMHPYDHWGFSCMTREENDLYWHYLTARLSAFRNVWWSHGGPLRGESWKRVRFLLRILRETPGIGLKRVPDEWDDVLAVPEEAEQAEKPSYRLYYYSFMRPSFREFRFEDGRPRRVEIIDTWNITAEDAGVHTGHFRITLPSRQYIAIRMLFEET